jgi:hypothetical protein
MGTGTVPYGRSIHGRCDLPEGYGLAIVPPDAQVSAADDTDEGWKQYSNTISSSYNPGKVLVATLQTLYASFTLYRARGGQLDQYGYAAFGLTVAPYAVMGLVNLVGNLVSPEYPSMYLVRSDILTEAENRPDAHFDGMVGDLTTQDIFPMWPRYVAPNLFSGSFELDSDGIPKTLSDLRSCAPVEEAEGVEKFTDKSMPEATKDLIKNALSEVEEGSQSQTQNISSHKTTEEVLPIVADSKSGDADSDSAATKESEPVFRIPACNNYTRISTPGVPPNMEKGVIEPNKIRFDSKAVVPALRNFAICIAIGSIPIVIIGTLSHFKAGSSTKAQRVWTMLWLALGIYIGPTAGSIPSIPALLRIHRFRKHNNIKFEDLSETAGYNFIVMASQWVWLFAYAAPAIGGFIVVGQMFHSFGSCIRL